MARRRLSRLRPGSAEWFVETEIKYGGIVYNVVRNHLSPHDPRYPAYIGTTGRTGGDRMSHHGYAPQYSQYIQAYLTTAEPLVVVEIGILKGTGLAIWSDLFPESRVIGLDIDLTHVRGNLPNLRASGAFAKKDVEVYEFDQFVPNRVYLGQLLAGDRIDICIDDGVHRPDAILTTIDSVIPHLNDQFVYFIEDNAKIHGEIRRRYPDYSVESYGELTVVTQSPAG